MLRAAILVSHASWLQQDLLNQMWMSPNLEANLMTTGFRFCDPLTHGEQGPRPGLGTAACALCLPLSCSWFCSNLCWLSHAGAGHSTGKATGL